MMKSLLLTASAFTLVAAPVHAQLLGGGGVTGSLNGTVGSTLRAPAETLRPVTRSTVRGDTATRGNQNVDRKNGSVAIDRSAETSLDATADQLLGTPAGRASGSANASGSGTASAQLIGTDAVSGFVRDGAGKARETVSTVRATATPITSSARDGISGGAGQAGNVAGSANGAASGAGMIDNRMLALAGSAAAQGEGAVAVAPGMPVQLPSGQQLGTVREIVATRSGQVRQLTVQGKDGLTTIPAGSLLASGNVLIAGGASGAASNERPAKANGAE